MAFEVLKTPPVAGRILRDEVIALRTAAAVTDYPDLMRRITARVEIEGCEQEMVFLTSNLEWSPASVADLYRCRWSIEAFFKQIKQTLQLADFLGPSASGLAHGPASACPVRRRRGGALAGLDGMAGLCAAALSLAFRHGWSHRFTRLFTLVRSALWRRWDRASLLHCAPPQSDPMGQPRATSASSPPHSSPALTAFDLSCGTAILLLPTEDRLKILNLTFPPATLPPCESGARYLVSTPYGMAVIRILLRKSALHSTSLTSELQSERSNG